MITSVEIAEYKPISRITIQGNSLHSYIDYAIEILQEAIGIENYIKLQKEEREYLIKGGHYECCNNTKLTYGVKRLLIEIAWIEIIKSIDINVTNNTIVKKSINESQSVTDGEKSSVIKQAQKSAIYQMKLLLNAMKCAGYCVEYKDVISNYKIWSW